MSFDDEWIGPDRVRKRRRRRKLIRQIEGHDPHANKQLVIFMLTAAVIGLVLGLYSRGLLF